MTGARHRSQPRRRRGWLDRAASAILGLVVVAALAMIVAGLFGVRLVVIESGSMTPTIRTGDAVLSRSMPATQIRPGQIVTFNHPLLHMPVTHRVVRVHAADGWIEVTTKGDANHDTESWRVPVTGRVGHTLFRIPAAGYVLRAVTLRTAGLAALVLALACLGVAGLRRIWRTGPDHTRRARPAGARIGGCQSDPSPSSPAPPAASAPPPHAGSAPRDTTSSWPPAGYSDSNPSPRR
ncbi:MAG TPA: signal peptidase I [Rugosimonospora sp.]|nr:signal peptidase I [Rugosimonospora sp.]